MAFPIDSPLPVFYDRNGDVLDAGFLWLGVIDTNPETNPIPVFWDAAQTQPAPQPLRTVRGFIARNGAPSALYVPSEYSIVVRDRNHQLLMNEPNSSTLAASGGSAQIGFIQAGTGAVLRTVQSKLRDAISILDFGAVGDDATDNQTAISACLTYATSVKRPVHVPAGIFRHSGVLTVSAVDLHGDGPQSELKATDTTSPNPYHAIYMIGNGTKVRNIKTSTTWTGARQSTNAAHAIALENCTNFEVSGVEVTGSAAAGILGQYCRSGRVFNNKVSNTLADGIHFTNDSHDVAIYANETNSTGDDAIAMVSYNLPRPAEYGGGNWPQSSRFTVFGNIIKGGSARGVSCIGSAEVVAVGNRASATAAAGFAISSESTYTSHNAVDVLYANNESLACATSAVLNHAQFYVYTQGSGYTLDRITLNGNTAQGSPARNAFRAQNISSGGPIDGLTVDGLTIDGTGQIALLNGTFDNAVIKDTTARNLADGPFAVTNVTGDVQIIGGQYWDVFQTPVLNRFVNLNGASGITSLAINGHDVVGSNNLSQVYGGDASSITARPFITALRNTVNRRALADVTGVELNGSNYFLPLSFTTNDINQSLAYAGTQAFEVLFSGTRHQALEVNFKIVRSNDPTQWQLLRQRWIYTNAAGVGTINVDYIDVGGGFRIQRTDIDNFSNGTVGTWALSLSGGNVTATFTPSVASHIRLHISGVYRSA